MISKFQKLRFWISAALVLTSCNQSLVNGRTASRPTDDSEESPSFINEIIVEVEESKAGEAVLEEWTIETPENVVEPEYKIRLRRIDPVELDRLGIVLTSDDSTVMQVSLLDEHGKIFPTEELIKPWTATIELENEISLTDAKLQVVSRPLKSDQTSYEVDAAAANSAGLVGGPTTRQLTFSLLEVNAILALKTSALVIAKRQSSTQEDGLSAELTIDNGAVYVASTEVTLNVVAHESAVEMYVTNQASCGGAGTWEGVTESKAWTLAQTDSVAKVYLKVRDGAGVESDCVSDHVIQDSTPPSAPGTFADADTSDSVELSPVLSWAAATDSESGIGRYLVAIGTSAGQSDVKTWTNIGSVTSIQISNLALTIGQTYYATIKAVNGAGLEGTAVNGDGWTVTGGSQASHRIFLSTSTISINKDTQCQLDANAASLGDGWKAIYSTRTVDAKNRILINGPLTPIGESSPIHDGIDFWTTSNQFAFIMNRDANGTVVTDKSFWSSTLSGMKYGSGTACLDWTTSMASETGWITSITTNPMNPSEFIWYTSASDACSILHRFLCIDGQD